MNAQTENNAAPTAEECWSVDEENFNARTLDDLIGNHDLEVGAVVFRAEAMHPEPKELIDVDDIIETMGERAYDIAGEYGEDYPDVSTNAVQELSEFLAGWITKHAPPTFYTVKNVQRYTVTEADVAPRAE
ncbi:MULTISPECIES: hypothetical protein [unclassified Duganella]|uniref:hypothetical protein n=1 Tax=unclassified Duganella TaxID=2636909 RepID=UPI00088D61DF|nr:MULTISPECIES: hypothetical protein [unclassified Duganella]SDF79586.1 hypothetical protein SAMN05216320_1011349 [Duganella sp. OV458]SDI49544.1 hypothetical protein SAMN05428973_10166 [Duganella sp. OV510]